MEADSAVEGFAPVIEVGVAPAPIAVRPSEREIYQTMWSKPEYRVVAPGEEVAKEFLMQAKPKPGSTCIDLGCGTGRGALSLAVFGGLDVTMLDFTDNSLDDDIVPMLETQKHMFRFMQADLLERIPVSAQYGFCTDVMEHIAPENIDRVLDNVLAACQHVFFMIATEDDVCGALIGHPLHLTVQPFAWWLAKFNQHDCVVHWSRDAEGHCMFYVTAWTTAKDIVEVGVLNVPEDTVREQVRTNLQAGWKTIEPHETNDLKVMILGGGPSLAANIDEIKRLKAEGVKIVTLNGAYNWALENDLGPVTQVMVDARQFNARFTHPVDEKCMYLISSQCHPDAFAGLPVERTYMWHTTTDIITNVLNEHSDVWWGVPGGSTVLLRAIPLLRMLGYKSFYLFGCDSCVTQTPPSENSMWEHHAYAQLENDNEHVLPITVGQRVFQCTTWQAAQAQEFMDLVKFLGGEIELEIIGGGLLAYILEHAAELAVDQEFLP